MLEQSVQNSHPSTPSSRFEF